MAVFKPVAAFCLIAVSSASVGLAAWRYAGLEADARQCTDLWASSRSLVSRLAQEPGNPTADPRSIAAAARAKIVYERLIKQSDDAVVRDT